MEISSDDFIQASTVFGGTEIDLTKADIQQPVVINTSTTFGGVKIIVPSNWQVNSDVTTIFGAVENQKLLFIKPV